MGTTRADMIRAVFEGTSFALRHVMETVKEAGAKANCLRICGGGAKSRTWALIKASMLRMPVYLLNSKSGDVPVGDALIVGRKVGVFQNLTEAVGKIIKVDEVIEPNNQWADAYDKLYPLYIDMYRQLDLDLKSIVMPAALSSKPEYAKFGAFAYGEVEIEEGTCFNIVVKGINKKKRKELLDKLPVNVHA